MAERANRQALPPGLGAILEFTRGEEKGRRVPLAYARTRLGRREGDILVRDANVSSRHLEIELVGPNLDIRVRDLQSSNGTYVEGERIVDTVGIEEKMEVQLGETAFHVFFDPEEGERLRAQLPAYTGGGGLTDLINREFLGPEQTKRLAPSSAPSPWQLEVLRGADQGKKIALSRPRLVLGRVDVDVVLADPDISRRHAVLERQADGQILLRDLASTNGTFVNDRRISNCVLQAGDQVRVGRTVLRLAPG